METGFGSISSMQTILVVGGCGGGVTGVPLTYDTATSAIFGVNPAGLLEARRCGGSTTSWILPF